LKAVLSNAFFKFIIRAGISYLLLYLVYQFGIKRFTLYDQKFIGLIIEQSDAILHLLGYTTFKILEDRNLQVIGIDGTNGLWVGPNCNAITLFFLFGVFIAAYPGRQKHKLWFIPAGMIAIHIINLIRVVVLCILALYVSPEYLDFNHTYTFTFLVYAFIFMLWMIWVNRFAAAKSAPDE
jgi:exosortase family protein XrtF